ncbi:hypothetical protein CH299_05835 [Rhodococcus sp. 14-2686-1-2]|nr:hypothetical protein CH301_05290 [Rhodococcus sp. 15-1189-1-1a]OZF18592.1 hypothetical protein CH299_05835 [Rhodococcus sp. 14-2686-1-2]
MPDHRILFGRLDLRGLTVTAAELRGAMPRGAVDVDVVLDEVRPVVEAVRDRGVDAAIDFGSASNLCSEILHPRAYWD